jgi:hypothetical protein
MTRDGWHNQKVARISVRNLRSFDKDQIRALLSERALLSTSRGNVRGTSGAVDAPSAITSMHK